LMESGAGFALLTAMVTSFEQQDIRTVFEGIEEGWQLELAEKSGASMVQGFVLARPELAPTSFSVFGMQSPASAADAGEAPASPNVAPSARPAKVFGRRTTP
jgi:EAL domain-containing protein (putative c-di-GMP-specific phosphodiesterase class I)